MDRNRQIAIIAGIALAAFLLGFVPQWMRANRMRDLYKAGELLAQGRENRAEYALRMAHVEGLIGAALTESMRSNYERARQLMTEVYSTLQAAQPESELRGFARTEVEAMLAQRDEIITLLARAAPESTQRLALLYTRYHNAFHPRTVPAEATPAPAP